MAADVQAGSVCNDAVAKAIVPKQHTPVVSPSDSVTVPVGSKPAPLLPPKTGR